MKPLILVLAMMALSTLFALTSSVLFFELILLMNKSWLCLSEKGPVVTGFLEICVAGFLQLWIKITNIKCPLW